MQARSSVAFLGLTLIAISSCGGQENKESDIPVSREQAFRDAGIRLPLPKSARDVRFKLSGGTQNWMLYLSYSVDALDIEKIIEEEVDSFRKRQDRLFGERPEATRDQVDSVFLTPFIEKQAPKWWAVRSIKSGFFVGYPKSEYGPNFWVDTEENKIYYFEHF